MFEYSFTALGTEWTLLSDGKFFEPAVTKKILQAVETFEDRFSRFREGSEVNSFQTSVVGKYPVSEELYTLLERSLELRDLTGGRFDPAGAVILEHFGYDRNYSFTEKKGEIPVVPEWSLHEGELVLASPIKFDLGGIGKGYCIDMVARILEGEGYQYYLVDGGGDMYATSKADGSPYQIALEWPNRPEVAYGVVELRYQGLAVTSPLGRRFGARHHIVDAKNGQNTSRVLGAVALGSSAWDADCATSALVQWPEVDRDAIQKAFRVESIMITDEEEILVSQGWPGKIFMKEKDEKTPYKGA